MQDALSKLFLEMESQIGTHQLAQLLLDAFKETIKDYQVVDDKTFCNSFKGLIKQIKTVRPRIGLITEDFYDLWQELMQEEEKPKNQKDPVRKCRDLKKRLKKRIKELKKQYRKTEKMIAKNVSDEIKNGDVILLHTYSVTIMDSLRYAIKKKKFTCILAEQEHEKTIATILELQKAKIPFKVVPEYMLSHIESEVTKVFIGALTISSFLNIVSNAGTNAVVSEFSKKIPIYLIMETRKCSFWEAKAADHSFSETQIKIPVKEEAEYTRIKFSHDRLPLKKFDFVITENGKMDSKTMTTWYKKEFAKRKNWRNMIY